MGFWIFMLIMDLLIPFTMIGFGKMFLKKAPDQINYVFGYRTSMSMKNQDTWVFAHHYCGKIWYICGLILLVVSLIVLFLVIGKSNDAIGNVGGNSVCISDDSTGGFDHTDGDCTQEKF